MFMPVYWTCLHCEYRWPG